MLARNGAAPVGDLRYLADTKLDDFATPIAKAQIAAALGMLGDKHARRARLCGGARARSRRSRRSNIGRTDYGSVAARRGRAGDARLRRRRAARDHRPARSSASRPRAALTPYTSTQENAWMVLAARALAKDAAGISLDVAGESAQGALYRTLPCRAICSSR